MFLESAKMDGMDMSDPTAMGVHPAYYYLQFTFLAIFCIFTIVLLAFIALEYLKLSFFQQQISKIAWRLRRIGLAISLLSAVACLDP